MAGTKQKRKRNSTTGKVRNVKADQSTWRRQLQQSRIKFDDDQKGLYLKALAEHGRKGDAARAAGVSQQCVRDHLDNDPDFQEQAEEAMSCYRDRLVGHHQTLLFEGEIHRRFNKDGELIEERHVYPVRLIELELKRHEPEYRERQTIDLEGAGAGVLVAPAEMSPQEWIEQMQAENEKLQAEQAKEPA